VSENLEAAAGGRLHVVEAVRDGFIEQATRDGLTGLYNRREMDDQVDAAVKLAQRHERPLAVLMADIDHFKQVNDTYGHAAGDEVIREVARRISAVSRGSDVVGRYGGEEYILLLPEASFLDAVTVGDKLRRILSERPIVFESVRIPVTMSVGAAAWDETMTASSLLAAADRALYQAKALGRNRTELFSRSPGSPTR
jgi:diguanylate cyclase (GGDEF)-like protein